MINSIIFYGLDKNMPDHSIANLAMNFIHIVKKNHKLISNDS